MEAINQERQLMRMCARKGGLPKRFSEKLWSPHSL